MYSENDLVYRKEKLYFGILLVTSIVVYLAMFVSIVGIVFLVALILFYWFIHNLTIVTIRKNGVRISEQQFPAFYEQAVNVAQRMNLTSVPDIYVVQSGGVLNAFATKFGVKNMVVLYSDIFALLEEQGEQEVLYVLAHEFAHIKRKHVGYGWLLMPGLSLPFLGSAYSRACEFTCDRYGAYYSESFTSAKNALTILAVGPQLYKKVDQGVFTQQIAAEAGVFGWIDEITSTHPNLPRRIHALDRFFNAAETDVIQTSKKGPILGAGLLLLVTVGAIFSGVWLVQQMDGLASANDLPYSSYDTESLNELMVSVVENDMDAVAQYAPDETMLNATNADGYTALHLAVLESNYEAVSYLLQQGADPNTLDSYEYTPLMEAIAHENMELIELLLTSGANKELTGAEGYTAHQLALDYGLTDIADYLETFE
ncbi:MAG: M48 family metallopeptidase [Solibacillus sp.]